jgi:NTE family protein
MTKVLVLAGGSVKGAFQAGVVRRVLEDGFKPDAIYGISAGSLNASYLVNQLGMQVLENEPINYVQAGKDLWDFWENRITHSGNLFKPFNLFQLGYTALVRRFKGLVSVKPLQNLITDVLQMRNLHASPVNVKIGAVNIIDGEIKYVDPSVEHYFDYLMASSAVPILMPVVKLKEDANRSYLDGGLREVSPIMKAIEDGATEIVSVCCHPERIEGGHLDTGNLLDLVDRVMDIAVNEILNADLREAQLAAQLGKHPIKIKSIRPLQPLQIDMQNFTKYDIRRLLELGYELGGE